MPSSEDLAQKYHAAIVLLAEAAEKDGARDLASLLESVASAISLDRVPELAEACMKFWTDRVPGDRGRGPRGA